jgi:omega-amidase
MRIAISQMRMSWTPEENLRTILSDLERAGAEGAELACFPELATTGFHRRVPEQLTPAVVERSLDRIRAACAEHAVAAVVGTPFYNYSFSPRPQNVAVAIDAAGEVLAICPKHGLTSSERSFFEAGGPRPTFTARARSASVILCREMRDLDALAGEMKGVEMVFWPGVIRWTDVVTVPDNHVNLEHAQGCARTLGAWVVQCNWPHSLNGPPGAPMGGSVVLTPEGEILARAPLDEVSLTLVDLPD